MTGMYKDTVKVYKDFIKKIVDRLGIRNPMMTIEIVDQLLQFQMSDKIFELLITINEEIKKNKSISRPNIIARSMVCQIAQSLVIIMLLSDEAFTTCTDNLLKSKSNYIYNLHLLRDKVISKATNGPYLLRWSKKCYSEKLIDKIISSYYFVNKGSLFFLFGHKSSKIFFFNSFRFNSSWISFTFNIEVTLYIIRLL